MNTLCRANVYVVSFVAHCVFVGYASADSTLWLASAGGLFTDGTKWSNGMPNSADDVAAFNSGGGATFTITFPAGNFPPGPTNYLTGATTIGANNVTFVPQTGPTLGDVVYTNTAILIGSPAATPAILTTSIQELVTTSAQLGVGSGLPGTLNVNGGTFKVVGNSADYDLIVGGDATGALTVNSIMSLIGAQGNAVLGKLAGVTGTVNVEGNGATWTNATGNPNSPLAVGGFGTGLLNITLGGKVVDFDAIVAREIGSNGTVTVSGVGSTWTNHGTAIVGGAGTGELNVTAGGLVSNNNLIVGGAGTGTMTISAGGQVFDFTSSIGETPPAGTGTVKVMGVGSKWNQTGVLRLGSDFSSNGMTASGSLQITAGGEVHTGGDALVGSVGSGLVTLIGSGSKWTVDGEMTVQKDSQVVVAGGAVLNNTMATIRGALSVDDVPAATWNVSDYLVVTGAPGFGMVTPGVISISDASHLNSRVAIVGENQRAGQAFIRGSGTIWSNPQDFYVGLDGTGELFVEQGAQVNSGPVQLGTAPVGNGSVTVDNSTWTSTDRLQIGVAGTGLLTVIDSGNVVADEVSIGPRGTVQGNSLVTADVFNGGTVSPGVPDPADPSAAFATLHVDGDYAQTAAGALSIQLDSLSSFDKLAVEGHVALDGQLKLSLLGGFMPAVGSAFQVITATEGISGTLDVVSFSVSPGTGGPGWTLLYSNTDVILKRVNFPQGDYNRNGVVDAADFVIWRDTLGSTTDRRANGDNTGASAGVIDEADYIVWKTHFGELAMGAGAVGDSLDGVSVPETASMLPLFGWISCLAFMRRRRRTLVSRRSICSSNSSRGNS